jgi:hypothetical protein
MSKNKRIDDFSLIGYLMSFLNSISYFYITWNCWEQKYIYMVIIQLLQG